MSTGTTLAVARLSFVAYSRLTSIGKRSTVASFGAVIDTFHLRPANRLRLLVVKPFGSPSTIRFAGRLTFPVISTRRVDVPPAGTVIFAGYSNSAGNYVTISHGGGLYTTYMHCSSLCVSKGQSVSRGQVIA